MRSRSILIAISYGCASVALSIFNKVVLASFHFDAIFLLFSVQLGITAFFLLLSKFVIIQCRRSYSNSILTSMDEILPSFQIEALKKCIIPALFFFANTSLSLLGYRIASIPAFQAIRRTGPLFTMILGALCFHQTPKSKSVIVSVLLITIGAFFAVDTIFLRDNSGVIIALLNNVLTASTFLLFRRVTDTSKISALNVCLHTSLINIPVALGIAFVFGEFEYLEEFSLLQNTSFQASIFLSGIFGFLLNVSSMLCVIYTSPLTTTLVGCSKDILLTMISIILFSDFHPSRSNWLGIGLSFFGSGLYAFDRYRHVHSNPEMKHTPISSIFKMCHGYCSNDSRTLRSDDIAVKKETEPLLEVDIHSN